MSKASVGLKKRAISACMLSGKSRSVGGGLVVMMVLLLLLLVVVLVLIAVSSRQ